MPSDVAPSAKSRVYRLVANILLHALAVLVVVILPPFTYDAVVSSGLRDVPGMAFVGGVAYPVYAVYWINRLKSLRAKFVLIHLVLLLSASLSIFVVVDCSWSASLFLTPLPALVGAAPLVAGVTLLLGKKDRRFAITCLLSSLVFLPVGVFLSLLFLYGVAMCGVGWRWG